MVKKSIVEAKYRRAKLITAFTFLWTDMPETLKPEIEKKLILNKDEEPIICFMGSINYSWVLTTSTLIIITRTDVNNYNYSLIKKVELQNLIQGKTTKLKNTSLTIILNDNTKLDIKVEQRTWHTIYNIIRFLINSSK